MSPFLSLWLLCLFQRQCADCATRGQKRSLLQSMKKVLSLHRKRAIWKERGINLFTILETRDLQLQTGTTQILKSKCWNTEEKYWEMPQIWNMSIPRVGWCSVSWTPLLFILDNVNYPPEGGNPSLLTPHTQLWLTAEMADFWCFPWLIHPWALHQHTRVQPTENRSNHKPS